MRFVFNFGAKTKFLFFVEKDFIAGDERHEGPVSCVCTVQIAYFLTFFSLFNIHIYIYIFSLNFLFQKNYLAEFFPLKKN